MNYEESIRQVQSGDTIYELNTPFMDGMRDARSRIYERKFTKYPGQNDEQADYDAGHAIQLELMEGGSVNITLKPLIAAAPELLRACKLALELSPKNDYETYRNAIKELMGPAITKAQEN